MCFQCVALYLVNQFAYYVNQLKIQRVTVFIETLLKKTQFHIWFEWFRKKFLLPHGVIANLNCPSNQFPPIIVWHIEINGINQQVNQIGKSSFLNGHHLQRTQIACQKDWAEAILGKNIICGYLKCCYSSCSLLLLQLMLINAVTAHAHIKWY